MLPLKDIIPPRRFPHLSTGLLIAAGVALVPLWWWAVLDRRETFFFAVNLLYLCVFADNVEDRLGRGRFALIYFASYGVGTVATMMLDPQARLGVGFTSPAVAGIIGAYVALYPNSRVLFFVPVPLDVHELPALFFVALYFILHVAGTAITLGSAAAGFLAGACLCLGLKRRVVW
jgi:membrane associated rhomboid family serine protease